MTETGSLDAAIAKHARWKHHLRQAVNTGQSEWTVEHVARADQCDFSRWLSQLPPVERRGEHSVKVRQLHTQFHTAAASVLELALEGRSAEAAELLSVGSDFAKLSSELVLAITAWKKDLASNA